MTTTTNHHSTQGFSLVEAIVAILILGVALAAIVPGFIFQAETTRNNELRTGGVAAAQQELDRLRRLDFATWEDSGTSNTVDSGLREYQVTIVYCEDGLDLCQTSVRHVRADVSYNGEEIHSVETVFTTLDDVQ